MLGQAKSKHKNYLDWPFLSILSIKMYINGCVYFEIEQMKRKQNKWTQIVVNMKSNTMSIKKSQWDINCLSVPLTVNLAFN